MGSRKVADLSVVTGEYQDRQSGQTKKKYLNVGALMKNDEGHFFCLINRTFNPAGVPGQEGRESIIVNVYQRDQQGGQSAPQGQPSGGYQQPPAGGQGGYGNQGVPGGGNAPQGTPPASFDDDIPF